MMKQNPIVISFGLPTSFIRVSRSDSCGQFYKHCLPKYGDPQGPTHRNDCHHRDLPRRHWPVRLFVWMARSQNDFPSPCPHKLNEHVVQWGSMRATGHNKKRQTKRIGFRKAQRIEDAVFVTHQLPMVMQQQQTMLKPFMILLWRASFRFLCFSDDCRLNNCHVWRLQIDHNTAELLTRCPFFTFSDAEKMTALRTLVSPKGAADAGVGIDILG